MPPVEFLAERKEAGQTIAELLRKRFNLSWSQAKRIVERGHVRVAGFAVSDPGHRVRSKNRIWIREGVITVSREAKPREAPPPPPASKPKPRPAAQPKPAPSPTQLPIAAEDLLYADDALVVVNKPAGLTTMRHAAEADEFGPRGKHYLPKTLADFLPHVLGAPGHRVIPVHRIDRDTSGVVVFARTATAADQLTRQFRTHAADRRYLALVRGTPKPGRIESVLVRDRGDGRRGSGASLDSKRAVTHVKLLEPLGQFALVECRLETGRTHQVRIHLGEAGTPLCGERVYDRPVNGQPLPDGSAATRPMLHAARLGFRHPMTNEAMTWEVPPPDDFARLLNTLRKQAPGNSDLSGGPTPPARGADAPRSGGQQVAPASPAQDFSRSAPTNTLSYPSPTDSSGFSYPGRFPRP